MTDEKVECRTPAEGRDGITRIPRWKYDAVRAAILAEVKAAGPDGAAFSDLAQAVSARLTDDDRARLGSVSWHTTVVKLNMEVTGEIVRLPKITPQRIALG